MMFNYRLKLYRTQHVQVEAIDDKHGREQISRQMNSQKQLFEFIDESDAEFSDYKETPTPVEPKRKRKIKPTKPVAFKD